MKYLIHYSLRLFCKYLLKYLLVNLLWKYLFTGRFIINIMSDAVLTNKLRSSSDIYFDKCWRRCRRQDRRHFRREASASCTSPADLRISRCLRQTPSFLCFCNVFRHHWIIIGRSLAILREWGFLTLAKYYLQKNEFSFNEKIRNRYYYG